MLSDDKILAGFRNADSRIVKEYFYGYCRVAYCIYDKHYKLRDRLGMDFYSLAHEYYLALYKHDFRQLECRKPTMSLRTWMVNGFRFLLLDKLKETKKLQRMESFEERMSHTQLSFDVSDSVFGAEFRNTITDICRSYYGRDSKNSIILQMLFIEGFKGKEVAAQLGMSPSAVTQRYNRMMHDVVVPYFKRYFVAGDYSSALFDMPKSSCCIMSEESENICYNRMSSSKSNEKFVGIDGFNWDEYMEKDSNGRVTPRWIDTLADNEVFVFGSNLAGMHGGGAARVACLRFGAVMGKGVGMQGRSYAIPTMQGGVDTIRPYVDEFIAYAKAHADKQFLVTPVGCGIAGFEPEDIAPLFRDAVKVKNISLPGSFWDNL